MSLTTLHQMASNARRSDRQGGFTLLELAIAITLVGLLAGGALLGLNVWGEHKLREENLAYMQEVKRALMAYAKVNGRLPPADADQNGTPDTGPSGWLPYAALGVRPKDVWGRQLRYHCSQYMWEAAQGANRCQALRSFATPGYTIEPFSQYVKVWDSDPAGTIFFVPAVIVSGVRDADKSGGVNGIYDSVTYAGFSRSNSLALNNNIFVRFPPNPPTGPSAPTYNKFDDMVVYLDSPILYATIGCGGPLTPAP